jgi:thiol-disulfide isomerase/thioredoxin
MGITEIPLDLFKEFISTMRNVWTADKYHLLDNNCNSFSDELCNFLVGRGIPKNITGLPSEFLETPLGKMLRPMIENQFGPSNHTTETPSKMIAEPAQTSRKPCYFQSESLSDLNSLISSNKCVVVDFSSKSCPPCHIISPEFKRLINEKNTSLLSSETTPKIIGVLVDIGLAKDIASQFQIDVTPTFKFFMDGLPFITFKGADIGELKNNIDLLCYTAYQPHKHSRLNLKCLTELCNCPPVWFSASSNLDSIMKKLKYFIAESQIEYSISSLNDLFNWAGNEDKMQFEEIWWETISISFIIFRTFVK